jgi:hypothetical protein
MARIVLTTWGSLGDVHPYVAIALGLKALVSTQTSLVRKMSPPCELRSDRGGEFARGGNLSRGCMCRDQWCEERVAEGPLRGDVGLQVHSVTASYSLRRETLRHPSGWVVVYSNLPRHHFFIDVATLSEIRVFRQRDPCPDPQTTLMDAMGPHRDEAHHSNLTSSR